MIVVSDTSPMRALVHLQLIPVLTALFDEIMVPPQVAAELLRGAARSPGFDVALVPGVTVRAPADQRRVTELMRELDPGESEALALALERGIDTVLIDETNGRRVAGRHGLQVVGTFGILTRAKARGLVSQVLPLVDRLAAETNFFVSAALRETVRLSAGE